MGFLLVPLLIREPRVQLGGPSRAALIGGGVFLYTFGILEIKGAFVGPGGTPGWSAVLALLAAVVTAIGILTILWYEAHLRN